MSNLTENEKVITINLQWNFLNILAPQKKIAKYFYNKW